MDWIAKQFLETRARIAKGPEWVRQAIPGAYSARRQIQEKNVDEVRPLFDLDLGDNHRLIWELDKDGNRAGALIEHLAGGQDHTPKGSYCAGGISWVPGWRMQNPWTLEGTADDHLTVSPSLRCSCGDHGFIRDGKWVRA